MTWSNQHDVALCREMLVGQPFRLSMEPGTEGNHGTELQKI